MKNKKKTNNKEDRSQHVNFFFFFFQVLLIIFKNDNSAMKYLTLKAEKALSCSIYYSKQLCFLQLEYTYIELHSYKCSTNYIIPERYSSKRILM
jgi:hypothetical protein